MGKAKTQRTEELRQAIARRRLDEQACNAIEQHNFDRLVKNGVIIEAQAEKSMLNPRAGAGEGRWEKRL